VQDDGDVEAVVVNHAHRLALAPFYSSLGLGLDM
jgi:hypothetical protein